MFSLRTDRRPPRPHDEGEGKILGDCPQYRYLYDILYSALSSRQFGGDRQNEPSSGSVDTEHGLGGCYVYTVVADKAGYVSQSRSHS